ncbi:hypothetical protein LPB86_06755 [Pedobacter sp. MC2016-14]|uniref:hypothetical protein n=1 Tax=Pedobacter sp. MC2016-14 TaxID=2897327 RepID=UPI001E28AB5C|nr:hypothetical protein [Pedobacter sp. MC2016-14]MCD0487921.1 hypothetical protein [Pedobacter sp. MC2016-14]
MLESAFDFGEELTLRNISYKLHHLLWKNYRVEGLDLSLQRWTTIKYLNFEGNCLNKMVNSIPNNVGGLYMFSIRCEIIPGMTEFPVYIGRAQYTNSQNLRKRCKEYYQKYSLSNERPKITRMFKYWSGQLYLSYIIIENNNDIIDLEKSIINSLLLPFNSEIPDIEIRQAVKAFNL